MCTLDISLESAMQTSGPIVVPLGCYDASGGQEKTAIVAIGWVLDTPLDALKLEAAWKKLSGSWPILSSRLRKNRVVDGIVSEAYMATDSVYS